MQYQMNEFLFAMILTELEDAVGKENCSTRAIDKVTHSVDYYWLSRMWADRGCRMPEADIIVCPEDAQKFVEQTGVACLAVAVGTAHGKYKKPPKLDIERIEAIRKATNNTALVLHGGSGVPDEEIKKAVKAGVRKMNFATDICYAFLDCCLDELQKPDRAVAIDNFMKRPIDAVKQFCISRIKLVGADGKA